MQHLPAVRESSYLKDVCTIFVIFKNSFPISDGNVRPIDSQQRMADSYSISLAENHGDSLVLHFKLDVQWEAKCLFGFRNGCAVVIVINQTTRFRDDENVINAHGSGQFTRHILFC